jgi:predicted AlkP superfamily phosphohydrolase/phosphomutase
MESVDRDDTIIVLSDHGFAPFYKSVHMNTLLRKLGFLALKEGAATSEEFFKQVDWSATQAYALGFNAIYLNLAGREGQGCVLPADADGLAARIASALESYADPDTGDKPIRKAYIARKEYAHSFSPDRPDIIVGYARGYRASWQTALGAAPEGVFQANDRKWSGDHCIDRDEVPGIFLSSQRALDADSLSAVGPAIVRYRQKSKH